MFRLIFRLLALVGALFTLLLLLVVAAAGYLIIAGPGSAPDCAPGPSGALGRAAQSIAFDAKLAAFVASGGRGIQSLTFDEEEASARAATYLAGQTGRISDVSLCFEDGGARGFMRVETVLGHKIGIEGKGTVDLKVAHPRIDLKSATVGGLGLPGFLLGPLEASVNDELTAVTVAFPLSVTTAEDEATVTRAP